MTGTFAQCICGTVAVVSGFPVGKCGRCGTTPIVLPVLGTFTIRAGGR